MFPGLKVNVNLKNQFNNVVINCNRFDALSNSEGHKKTFKMPPLFLLCYTSYQNMQKLAQLVQINKKKIEIKQPKK